MRGIKQTVLITAVIALLSGPAAAEEYRVGSLTPPDAIDYPIKACSDGLIGSSRALEGKLDFPLPKSYTDREGRTHSFTECIAYYRGGLAKGLGSGRMYRLSSGKWTGLF